MSQPERARLKRDAAGWQAGEQPQTSLAVGGLLTGQQQGDQPAGMIDKNVDLFRLLTVLALDGSVLLPPLLTLNAAKQGRALTAVKLIIT